MHFEEILPARQAGKRDLAFRPYIAKLTIRNPDLPDKHQPNLRVRGDGLAIVVVYCTRGVWRVPSRDGIHSAPSVTTDRNFREF
jgi:hypothetical protein